MNPILRSLAVILFLALPCGAALPRKAIEEYQAKAPTLVALRVTEVKKVAVVAVVAGQTHSYHLTVSARILKVHRGGEHLRKGDEITISYDLPNWKKSPAAGDFPSEVKKNSKYKAYLKVRDAKKKHCLPAAYSGTFQALQQ